MPKFRSYKPDKQNYWKQLGFKEKIDYFFQYYFGWTVAFIVLAVIVAVNIIQASKNYSPDYELLFVSDVFFYDDELNKMENVLKFYAEDIDGDGREEARLVSAIFYGDEPSLNEYNTMIQQRLVIQLSRGEPMLCIISPDRFDNLTGMGVAFVPLPEGVKASEANEYTAEFIDTKLYGIEAFSKIPDNYLFAMIDISAIVKEDKAQELAPKRELTYSMFKAILGVK